MSWVLLGELTPDGFCWRTSEDCLRRTKVKLYGRSSLRWPTTGTMRGGRVFALPMSVPRTDGSGGSALLPTPTAGQGRNNTSGRRQDSQHNTGETLQDVAYRMARGMALLPTPTSRDHKGRNQRDDASCLPGAVERLLPTPRASDANGAGHHGTGGPDLRTAISELSNGDLTSPPSDDGNTSWEQPPLFP